MEGNKIDYYQLMYRSGDNQYFDFNKFGTLSSFYLKLVNGNVGINVSKLNMNEFKNEIDGLKKRKQRNRRRKQIKKMPQKML